MNTEYISSTVENTHHTINHTLNTHSRIIIRKLITFFRTKYIMSCLVAWEKAVKMLRKTIINQESKHTGTRYQKCHTVNGETRSPTP